MPVVDNRGALIGVIAADDAIDLITSLLCDISGSIKHERDVITARPGRVVNRAAGIRQSFEPKVSARRYLMQRWLKAVGLELQSFLAGHDSEGAILVAGPRTLAELRRFLPSPVRTRVRTEIAHDLIHQPLLALRKRLQPAVGAHLRMVSYGEA